MGFMSIQWNNLSKKFKTESDSYILKVLLLLLLLLLPCLLNKMNVKYKKCSNVNCYYWVECYTGYKKNANLTEGNKRFFSPNSNKKRIKGLLHCGTTD